MTQIDWHNHLMKTYNEMKKKDPSVKLKDAMIEAKKTYKK
jgi:hypothetical protein